MFYLQIAFFDEDAHSSGRLTSALATDAAYIRGAVADAFAVGLQVGRQQHCTYLMSLEYVHSVSCQHACPVMPSLFVMPLLPVMPTVFVESFYFGSRLCYRVCL